MGAGELPEVEFKVWLLGAEGGGARCAGLCTLPPPRDACSGPSDEARVPVNAHRLQSIGKPLKDAGAPELLAGVCVAAADSDEEADEGGRKYTRRRSLAVLPSAVRARKLSFEEVAELKRTLSRQDTTAEAPLSPHTKEVRAGTSGAGVTKRTSAPAHEHDPSHRSHAVKEGVSAAAAPARSPQRPAETTKGPAGGSVGAPEGSGSGIDGTEGGDSLAGPDRVDRVVAQLLATSVEALAAAVETARGVGIREEQAAAARAAVAENRTHASREEANPEAVTAPYTTGDARVDALVDAAAAAVAAHSDDTRSNCDGPTRESSPFAVPAEASAREALAETGELQAEAERAKTEEGAEARKAAEALAKERELAATDLSEPPGTPQLEASMHAHAADADAFAAERHRLEVHAYANYCRWVVELQRRGPADVQVPPYVSPYDRA